MCKQEPVGQYPKYVVLEERLLLQLEAILQLVNTLGSDVDTLHVMSGYRTPSYNRALGDAQYSMHQWGGAADIFVDEDDKFRMDDLNRDGRIDTEDARYLAGISTRCSRPRRTADSRGASACTAPPRRIRRSCTLTCAARNQSSSSCFRVFVVAKGPREQWGC